METYQSAPSVELIAPLDELAANEPLNPSNLSPGMAAYKPVGELAEVGEFKELWWAASKPAFGVTANGDVILEFREPIFRLDTPGARTVRESTLDHATGMRSTRLKLDISGCRDIKRQANWLRLDPVVRARGFSDDGLLPYEVRIRRDKLVEFSNRFMDPEILADIAELNDVVWNQVYRLSIYSQLSGVFTAYVESLRRNETEKDEHYKRFESNCEAWREAFDKADEVLAKRRSGEVKTPAKSTTKRSTRGSAKGE